MARVGRISLLALCAALLCALFCGCVVSKADRQGFVGSWELVGIEADGDGEGGQGISDEELESMRELGAVISLEVSDDGSVVLDQYGQRQEGTWEARSRRSGTVYFGDKVSPMQVEGDRLVLQDGTDSMTFERA